MMYVRSKAALCLLLPLLSACYTLPDNGNEASKRDDAKQTCEAMGYIPPGTTENERCIVQEKASRGI